MVFCVLTFYVQNWDKINPAFVTGLSFVSMKAIEEFVHLSRTSSPVQLPIEGIVNIIVLFKTVRRHVNYRYKFTVHIPKVINNEIRNIIKSLFLCFTELLMCTSKFSSLTYSLHTLWNGRAFETFFPCFSSLISLTSETLILSCYESMLWNYISVSAPHMLYSST